MAFGSKHGFVGRRRTLELHLDAEEALLLQHLFTQVEAMLTPPDTEQPSGPLSELLDLADSEPPDDPALLRLFPDAYREDQEAAGEFRRFTERGLREGKAQRLRTTMVVLHRVAESDEPVTVTGEEADAFLRSLNDLRLVLGVRLGIETDEQDVTEGWAGDDPRYPIHGAYQWLTWLQSTLLEALEKGR